MTNLLGEWEDKINHGRADLFPESGSLGWTMGVGKRHPQREKT